MKTLEHPPIMDFYRNTDNSDGTYASRPSMLELLHGGEKCVSSSAFENFKVYIFCYLMNNFIF